MTTKDIRNKWIEFFTKSAKEKFNLEHKQINSASLVPDNPTLLLNAAGMVQFVPYFTGAKQPPEPPRAITIQKCVRVGGKDSDLDNIGRTTRHHSFFEMLGNFSFGDYFKKEAIAMAFEFVTKELEFPIEKLYFSVFEGDEQNDFDSEAYGLWQKLLDSEYAKLDADFRTKYELNTEKRIWKMNRKENFWGPPGTTGPCGPCSEIYYDLGAKDADGNERSWDDRYIEIWNLVFMQYQKDEDGKFTALENKNIDTGAGLERIATIKQEVANSFETDELFAVLKKVLQELAAEGISLSYSKDDQTDLYLKIITDHVRCLSFLIADGVRPSNLGRGYVLRMIIRRGARFAYLLRHKASAFLYKICETVIKIYAEFYPELVTNQGHIINVCKKEEEQFCKTLEHGFEIINKEIDKKVKTFSGDFVFDLYSTYGFPFELSSEIAQENGIEIDEAGYLKAKEKHSQVSNTGQFAKSVDADKKVAEILKEFGETKFIGYKDESCKAKLIAIINSECGTRLSKITQEDIQADKKFKLVFDQTVFYAESGGQLGDKGVINTADAQQILVRDTQKKEGIFLHHVDFDNANASNITEIALGQEFGLEVDSELRKYSKYHHTNCHLLQAALKKVIGEHIQQAGSLVGPEYTRFDFSNEKGLTKDELAAVEKQINDWIKLKLPVKAEVMPYDDAINAGALAFFEEKYGDEVRVLKIADEQTTASVELCGGVHVDNIAEIKIAKIVSEGSVAAGIRRIKMLTNTVAEQYIREQEEIAQKLEQEKAAKEQAKAMAKELKKKQLATLKEKLEDLCQQAQEQDGAKVLIANLSAKYTMDIEAEVLKDLANEIKNKLEADDSISFILLAASNGAKASIIASASKDADKQSSKFHAGNAVKEIAKACGGGGGGKANFAQAGARDLSKFDQACHSYLSIATV